MALKAAVALTIFASAGSAVRTVRRTTDDSTDTSTDIIEGAESSTNQCGKTGASISLDDGPNASIVNGDDAKECAWKWQVGLKSSASGRPWCGGMLIAPDVVLTAAHCLEGESQRGIYVVAGEWNTRQNSGNEQVKRSRKLIMHRDYNDRTTENDIALIKVESAFRMNNCVGTVCLPSRHISSGSTCWITGWGTLSEGGRSPSILQQGKVKIVSHRDCTGSNSGYRRRHVTEPDMLCAQGSKNGKVVDACQGDSGGPLVCESRGTWTVHGATSWGYGCARDKYPGVWAKVHHFSNWIKNNM